MSRKPWSLLGLQGYFEVSCEFTPNSCLLCQSTYAAV